MNEPPLNIGKILGIGRIFDNVRSGSSVSPVSVRNERTNSSSNSGTNSVWVIKYRLEVGDIGDLLWTEYAVHYVAEVSLSFGCLGESLEIVAICYDQIFDAVILQHRHKLFGDVGFHLGSRGLLLAHGLMEGEHQHVIRVDPERRDVCVEQIILPDLGNQEADRVALPHWFSERQVVHGVLLIKQGSHRVEIDLRTYLGILPKSALIISDGVGFLPDAGDA